MKKTLLFSTMLSMVFCVNAQNAKENTALQDKNTEGSTGKKQSFISGTSNAPEVTIWSEDFASGIPSSWVNAGFDGFGNTLTNAKWEYRGTATTPPNTTGSRGAYVGTRGPVLSPTASNGFIIFDSDYLDNNGIVGNTGNGPAAAPHLGTLTTDTIDLSGYNNVGLKFSSYHRYFEGRAIIAVSTDGGTTWSDTLAAHPGITVNAATAANATVEINMSAMVGNQSNVMLRFIFDGTYDDPGANGSGAGYYFWMIDDIEFYEIPKHDIRFTRWNGAPPQDIIFAPAAGSGKFGHLSKNQGSDQTRDMTFDANAFNFGYGSLNNVYLKVNVMDNNNTLINSYTSTGSVNLNSTDTANYNTLNTYNTPYNPSQVATYKVYFQVIADSASAISDTTSFYITDSLISLDYKRFDNSLGTPSLGDDGSALAMRMELTNTEYMRAAWVGLSSLTVAGGSIEVEVYDTVGFDFIAGFPAGSLKAASTAYVITQDDVDNGYFQVPVSDGVNPFVMLNSGAYYVVVRMYSNAGTNEIRLRNDQSIEQPSLSRIMYNTTDLRWYTGYSNSLTLNAPHIRAVVGIWGSIEEDKLRNAIDITPNPARDFINLSFTDLEGSYTLKFYDITGKLVLQEELVLFGISEHRMDVNHLPAGLYSLQISNAKSQATYKIVKQ